MDEAHLVISATNYGTGCRNGNVQVRARSRVRIPPGGVGGACAICIRSPRLWCGIHGRLVRGRDTCSASSSFPEAKYRKLGSTKVFP